jgi:hypothetical protein
LPFARLVTASLVGNAANTDDAGVSVTTKVKAKR